MFAGRPSPASRRREIATLLSLHGAGKENLVIGRVRAHTVILALEPFPFRLNRNGGSKSLVLTRFFT
jgi:hypothetical protein